MALGRRVEHQNGLGSLCLATAMPRALVYVFLIWSPIFHTSSLLFGLSETQDSVQRRLLLPLSIRERIICWMVGDAPAKRNHIPADTESTPYLRRNQGWGVKVGISFPYHPTLLCTHPPVGWNQRRILPNPRFSLSPRIENQLTGDAGLGSHESQKGGYRYLNRLRPFVRPS